MTPRQELIKLAAEKVFHPEVWWRASPESAAEEVLSESRNTDSWKMTEYYHSLSVRGRTRLFNDINRAASRLRAEALNA